MLLSLGLIMLVGFLGGLLFEKIKIPKIIFYLLIGILFGPSLLNLFDAKLLEISSYLRQIALVIIITRSGLSLDFKGLIKIGRPAILMCFLPATFEMIGVLIFGPILLNISQIEALLLGSVLAAVSPAIVVPRMIDAKKRGYNPKVSEVILAGSSCDDVYVIVLFYSFLGLAENAKFNPLSLLKIPSSILLGIMIGLLFGLLLYALFKLINANSIIMVVITFSLSLLLLGLEELIKPYISVSSLIAIITIGIFLASKMPNEALKIEDSYKNLWAGFEILLFSLVGATVDLNYALSLNGLLTLVVILIGLLFRMIGVFLALIKTPFNFKERLYMMLSYIPKATVQASIGGICLWHGLACGGIVLTAAVISILFTAPLGAVLMDKTKEKLLIKADLTTKEDLNSV